MTVLLYICTGRISLVWLELCLCFFCAFFSSFVFMPYIIYQEIDPCEDITDEDIRLAIQNATGPKGALFVPEVLSHDGCHMFFCWKSIKLFSTK